MNIFIQMDLFVCQLYMMAKFILIRIITYTFLFFLEWSAALTVSSICMSLISMLSGAKKKVIKL